MGSQAGSFVVYEGVDGAGTTTQAMALVAALKEKGQAALYTREPSDGSVGRYIRKILQGKVSEKVSESTLAALFAADRLDHLDQEIRPALREGFVVVCDRYLLSSMTYQGVMTGDREWVAALNRRASEPDLTILLDVPHDEAARRRAERLEDVERYEIDETQRAVAEAYRELAAEVGAKVLDGTRPRAELTQEVMHLLEEVK